MKSWSQEGEILSVDYTGYDYFTGEPEQQVYRLTLRLLEGGSFCYCSNQTV